MSYYQAEWHGSGRIPARAVRVGLLDLDCAVPAPGEGYASSRLAEARADDDLRARPSRICQRPSEEELQRLDRTLPVIVVTGNKDAALARRALASGAFHYLAKPFDVEALDRVAAAAIGERERRRQQRGR